MSLGNSTGFFLSKGKQPCINYMSMVKTQTSDQLFKTCFRLDNTSPVADPGEGPREPAAPSPPTISRSGSGTALGLKNHSKGCSHSFPRNQCLGTGTKWSCVHTLSTQYVIDYIILPFSLCQTPF